MSPTSLIAVAIAHIVAVTVTIALVAVVTIPLVAVTIALFVANHANAMALAAFAPSCPSSLASCCVASLHTATSHLPSPPRAVASCHTMASGASCPAGCCVASPIAKPPWRRGKSPVKALLSGASSSASQHCHPRHCLCCWLRRGQLCRCLRQRQLRCCLCHCQLRCCLCHGIDVSIVVCGCVVVICVIVVYIAGVGGRVCFVLHLCEGGR